MLNDRPSGNFGICISTSASTLAGSDIGVAEFFFFLYKVFLEKQNIHAKSTSIFFLLLSHLDKHMKFKKVSLSKLMNKCLFAFYFL